MFWGFPAKVANRAKPDGSFVGRLVRIVVSKIFVMTEKLILVLLFLTALGKAQSQQESDRQGLNELATFSESIDQVPALNVSNMKGGRGISLSVSPYPLNRFLLDCLYFLIFAVLVVRIIKLLETVGFVIARKDDRSRHSDND